MDPTLPFMCELLDLLPDAVCVVDSEGRLLFVSASFEHILGYAPSEVIGRRIFELIHPDDVASTVKQGIGNSNALLSQSGGQATAAQAPFRTRFGGPRAGFRLRAAAQRRSPGAFPADSRRQADRSPAGSWPHRGVFQFSSSVAWPADRHAAAAGGARAAGR
jgi:PAS domain-containing protein